MKPEYKDCPNTTDHTNHYWRFKDEPVGTVYECSGYLRIEVDVLERPTVDAH